MTRRKRYEPVGRCIYCGNRPPAHHLTEEHIIPRGLGGALILPEASCERCQKETSGVETRCLRKFYQAARSYLKLPTYRKPKDRRTSLPLDIERRGVPRAVEVPISEYPGMIITFVFSPPAILCDLPLKEEELTGGVAIGLLPQFGNNLRRANPLKRPVSFGIGGAAIDLGRMLAKIAHGYAVAEVGSEKFRPYLTDIIRGRSLLHAGHCIGGDFGTQAPPPSQDLHDISFNLEAHDGRTLLVVSIRLFANREGMPNYRVVAGELL